MRRLDNDLARLDYGLQLLTNGVSDLIQGDDKKALNTARLALRQVSQLAGDLHGSIERRLVQLRDPGGGEHPEARRERKALERLETQPWRAERAAEDIIDDHFKSLAAEQSMEVSDHVERRYLEAYDEHLFGGKPLGDIWYDELEEFRRQGLFQANLAASILAYGIPNEPTRVRDFVPAGDLEKMVREARTTSECPLAAHRDWMASLLAALSNEDEAASAELLGYRSWLPKRSPEVRRQLVGLLRSRLTSPS
jgi:hypothetical protein